MGRLIDGKWSTEWYTPDEKGRFQRDATVYRDRVTRDGSSGYEAEAGRYHLYVSYACPWAHRTLIVRQLLGLERAIDISVVDPHMTDDGWNFGDAHGATQDHVHGKHLLREVYLEANPRYTGRVTVPVLWDKQAGKIVCNESREIIRMLDHEFTEIAERPLDLCPPALTEAIDSTITDIYEPINNGVYRCGFAHSQAAYDEAVGELFDKLDHYDALLGTQRYLCGATLTEADICLFTTLLRFDLVYHYHFKCNRRRIQDYQNLWGFTRDVYQTPGVAETCDFWHIKRHYYWSHTTINPCRIVPVVPTPDFDAPHDRQHLS